MNISCSKCLRNPRWHNDINESNSFISTEAKTVKLLEMYCSRRRHVIYSLNTGWHYKLRMLHIHRTQHCLSLGFSNKTQPCHTWRERCYTTMNNKTCNTVSEINSVQWDDLNATKDRKRQNICCSFTVYSYYFITKAWRAFKPQVILHLLQP